MISLVLCNYTMDYTEFSALFWVWKLHMSLNIQDWMMEIMLRQHWLHKQQLPLPLLMLACLPWSHLSGFNPEDGLKWYGQGNGHTGEKGSFYLL